MCKCGEHISIYSPHGLTRRMFDILISNRIRGVEMPTISESKKGGIKIAVNYSDHNPPHFHVIKGRKTVALVSIRDAVVLEGSLSRALLHRVLGWCVSHTKELLADWELARQGKEPKWIDWTID